MRERRRNSKVLPIIFLFLQIIALGLLSYNAYLISMDLHISKQILLAGVMMINIFAIMQCFNKYRMIKNRMRYMEYQ